MLILLLAVLLFLLTLWVLFRFAMGLRYAKLMREDERAKEEGRGRRIVGELPVGDGIELFLEDESRFYWGDAEVPKGAILGVRLLLNGGIMGGVSRQKRPLPDPPPASLREGHERWDVILYLEDGTRQEIPCGTLREGISRGIAEGIFESVRRVVSADSPSES